MRGQEWGPWFPTSRKPGDQYVWEVHTVQEDLYLGVSCRSHGGEVGQSHSALSTDRAPLSAQRGVYPAEIHLPVALQYRFFSTRD